MKMLKLTAPVFDAWVLPKGPLAAYSGGQQHDVTIIVGSTRNEGALYLVDETDLSVERHRSFLKSRFADNSWKAFEMFPAYQAKDVARAMDDFLTVAANAQPARFVAQSMGPKQSKAYLFQFTRRPDTAMARKLGVHLIALLMSKHPGVRGGSFGICLAEDLTQLIRESSERRRSKARGACPPESR